jgi:molybdenum cofactor biosynthesis enzyme MoaA
VFLSLGGDKVRLTGGEPLPTRYREVVRMVAANRIADLALTTNAYCLPIRSMG